jgi:hypothetical protein
VEHERRGVEDAIANENVPVDERGVGLILNINLRKKTKPVQLHDAYVPEKGAK